MYPNEKTIYDPTRVISWGMIGALALGAVALWSGPAKAVDQTLDVTATLLAPLATTQITGLDMGDIDFDPAVGFTYELDTAGVITFTGGEASTNVFGASPGEIEVTGGAPSAPIVVTVPNTFVASVESADVNFKVRTCKVNGDAEGVGSCTGTLDAGGAATSVLIGGTIDVLAGATAATYTQVQTVTVNFQ